jgi:2-hydroxychromene-2-carboxylate isomerase
VAPHRDPVARLRARGVGVLQRRAPAVELYYEPGDPHSHLCAQLLPMLRERVRTRIDIRLVGQSGPDDYPEADRQRSYALLDAARIAPARALQFPADARAPDAATRRWAAGELARSYGDVAAFAGREADVARALFAGDTHPAATAEPVDQLFEANMRRRQQLGHNLPGVWQFDGDWFWGVDRLGYLEARLRKHDLLDGPAPLSELLPDRAALPRFAAELPPLEFFYSFRSPYSYLAVVEMHSFHSRWPTGIQVRPVLPMAMRNISVPRVKRLYTLRDVKREADRRGVPFGRVADPLGDGARRCLQTFPLATGTQQQLDFLLSASRAVFAEGVDVATDDGLRYVVERAGIPWEQARGRLASGADIDYAEENRRDLLASGLWGVPCYRIGEFAAWGQDRFWMLSEILRRSRATAQPAGAPDRSSPA